MMSSYADLRREMVTAGQKLFRLGLQWSTGGNLSIRIPGTDMMLTKPSGKPLADCRPCDLVLVKFDGVVVEGEGKPTKEVWFHSAIYQVRPDVGGVCHVHAPFATGFACVGRELPLVTVHSRRILKKVPVLPPSPDGSAELASNVETAFRSPELVAVLLADHGVVTVGPTLAKAVSVVELVEETAKTAIAANMVRVWGF